MSDLELPVRVQNPLALLQAAIDKGMDPDKLGKLMDLAERWEKNQAANTFAEAIRTFQSEMPAVPKGNPVYGKNRDAGPQYHFADFADIMDVAQPILQKCG